MKIGAFLVLVAITLFQTPLMAASAPVVAPLANTTGTTAEQKAKQQAMLANFRAAFNQIAATFNASGAALNAIIAETPTQVMIDTVNAVNAVANALNASGQKILAAIKAVDAIVVSDPAPPVGSFGTTLIVTDGNANGTQQSAPITFGHPFKKGDIPAGTIPTASIGSTSVPMQVDSKASHADGSLRHAVLTLKLPQSAAAQAQTIDIKARAVTAAVTPVSVSALTGTAFDVVVQLTIAGTVYSASAKTALAAKPDVVWLSGPLVSENEYFVIPKDPAGNPHPSLRVIFDVRAYGLDRARVDVVIENNLYRVTGQDYVYDASIATTGSPSYAVAGLRHLSNARWHKAVWWGADPRLSVKMNRDYFLSTGVVPPYDKTIPPTPTVSSKEADFPPMTAALIARQMPDTGGRPELGILPGFAAKFSLSMEDADKQAVLIGGTQAASWRMHWRDPNTNRPVSLDDYPYMTILGGYNDSYNPKTGAYEALGTCWPPGSAVCFADDRQIDSAHQPSMAFLPYVITGDRFYLDELKFWANYNMIQFHPAYRSRELGLFSSDQIRGVGWDLRTLGQLVAAIPDAEADAAYFKSKFKNNMDFFNSEYVNNPKANIFHFLEGRAYEYQNGTAFSPWQDHFVTQSVCYLARSLKLDQAEPLCQWKSEFSIGLMTLPFCYIYASSYFFMVKDVQYGPITVKNWQEFYNRVYAPGADLTQCPAGADMVGGSNSAEGYPSNLQPALAYAVGSASHPAWVTFMSRKTKPNYLGGYAEEPQFSIVPFSP